MIIALIHREGLRLGFGEIPLRQRQSTKHYEPSTVSSPVISVENLGKRYRIRHQQMERYTTLRELRNTRNSRKRLRRNAST